MKAITKERLIAFEDRVAALWEAGELPFLLHLCGGNEEQLLTIFEEIQPGDWVFSGHRSHYHYLCKGGSEERLEAMIRRGDSMFVFDRELRFFTSSVLAATCCIAAGVAWALKEASALGGEWKASASRGLAARATSAPMPSCEGSSDRSSVARSAKVWCFLGDGASEQGHFYEAVCYVQANELPCTFVIEDNDRSVDTTKAQRGHCNALEGLDCVRRYSYVPRFPHAGNGTSKKIVFKEASVSGSASGEPAAREPDTRASSASANAAAREDCV